MKNLSGLGGARFCAGSVREHERVPERRIL